MNYNEIKKQGRKIYEEDKYGQGPYDNVYSGTIEYWVADNKVYVHTTNDNGLSNTGRPSFTEFVGRIKDESKIKNLVEDLGNDEMHWSDIEYHLQEGFYNK